MGQEDKDVLSRGFGLFWGIGLGGNPGSGRSEEKKSMGLLTVFYTGLSPEHQTLDCLKWLFV